MSQFPNTEFFASAHGVVACRKHPLVYLNIPKCSCTTIKNVLYLLDHKQLYTDPLDIHDRLLLDNLLINCSSPEELKTALSKRTLSFTFVRNPFKRIFSCFNEKIYFESRRSFSRLRNGYLKNNYGVDFSFTDNYSLDQHQANYKKFLLFVRDNLADKSNFRKDGHWDLQTKHHISGFQRFTTIDFIGRLERYQTDMSYVLNAIGIENAAELSQLKFNEGPPPPFSYHEVMTAEINQLVYDIYEHDFFLLGYD
jgi:hypothetical protein